MSGGHFNGNETRILGIIDDLEECLKFANKSRKEVAEIRKRESGEDYHQDDFENYWSADRDYAKRKKEYEAGSDYEYSKTTIRFFKQAVKALKRAYVYANRIDYFLSGDDGEKEFHERLREELNDIVAEDAKDKDSCSTTLK